MNNNGAILCYVQLKIFAGFSHPRVCSAHDVQVCTSPYVVLTISQTKTKQSSDHWLLGGRNFQMHMTYGRYALHIPHVIIATPTHSYVSRHIHVGPIAGICMVIDETMTMRCVLLCITSIAAMRLICICSAATSCVLAQTRNERTKR